MACPIIRTGHVILRLFQSSLVLPLKKEEILNNVYYKEMLMIIQLTLEKMPKRRRLIFELSRFRGLSHKEIADKLDVSIRTIEHQVYLALIELKKVLLFFIFFL